MNKESLVNNIRNIRKNMKLTQEQFSEKIDICTDFLSDVECGNVGISLNTAMKICKVSKVSPNQLFEGIISFYDVNDKYICLSEKDKLVIN